MVCPPISALRAHAIDLARLGAGVGLSASALIAVSSATSSSLMLAPFAATAALAHAAPDSPLVRPRSILGGYLVGAGVGVALGILLGPGLVAAGVAAAVAAVLLAALRVQHPPGVAMALVALQAPVLATVGIALAGALTLITTALLVGPVLHGHPFGRPAAATS